MCIMEVRPGQATSTIAQAMAHNVSTIERDMDMFEALIKARGDEQSLDVLTRVHDDLRRAYAELLMQFGFEVAKEIQDGTGHLHTHDHGNERSFVEQAHRDAGLARKFETR